MNDYNTIKQTPTRSTPTSRPRRGAIGKALIVWLLSGSVGLALLVLLVFGVIGC